MFLGRVAALRPYVWLRGRLSGSLSRPHAWLSGRLSGSLLRPHAWLRGRLAGPLSNPRTPLVLLGVVCVFGVGLRVFHLGIPAASRPGAGYIFDEHYYVSAARVIAGKPTTKGEAYARASPSGTDPNGEHPQLGKLFIAGGISLFGDNTIGWRIASVAFGAAAILLMYWLVRCEGGGPWLALGAASLASVDNLWMVHSRIAVLDVYVLPFMLAAAGFYLRGRPIIAGVLIGAGCCAKEFGVYAVLVLILLELMRALRWWSERRVGTRSRDDAPGLSGDALGTRPGVGAPGSSADAPGPADSAREPGPARALSRWGLIRGSLVRPVVLVVVAGVTFFTLLTVLDTAVTPYSGGHPVDRKQAGVCKYTLIWRDACNHFAFMNRYASRLVDHGHPQGIAARPTEFWLNRKAITYFKVTQTVTATGKPARHMTLIWFRGEISRVLLITSWFGLLLNLWWAIRRRDDLSFLVVAWALGTWLPPEFFNAVEDRTTYLYYMVVTMPALYIAVARLLGAWRVTRWLTVPWVVLLLYDAANLYPFRTLSGT